MTKKEAIDLIKQVCAIYRGTLQEHQTLQEAIKTLETEEKKDSKG